MRNIKKKRNFATKYQHNIDMPKVLQIILSSLWIFSFYDTDINENRAHVHAGHRGTRRLIKIWLEPEVKLADSGEMNSSEANEALKIAKQYKEDILAQWNIFKTGKPITIIKK